MSNVAQRVLFWLALLLGLAGVFVGLNLLPDYDDKIDWNDHTKPNPHAIETYGWPNTYFSSYKYLENPGGVFGDGGTLNKPRFDPPEWATKQEFDADALWDNVYWCVLSVLALWFIAALLLLLWIRWLDKYWSEWWIV